MHAICYQFERASSEKREIYYTLLHNVSQLKQFAKMAKIDKWLHTEDVAKLLKNSLDNATSPI